MSGRRTSTLVFSPGLQSGQNVAATLPSLDEPLDGQTSMGEMPLTFVELPALDFQQRLLGRNTCFDCKCYTLVAW